MKIIAKAVIGHEYLYSKASAHSVPVASAEKIRHYLNTEKHDLSDYETWFLYDVDEWEYENCFAPFQSFHIRKNRLYESFS